MSLALATFGAPLRFVELDGRATEGTLYLHIAGGRAAQPETIVDRLNEPGTSFVPLKVDGTIELLHLAWIAYVACPGRPPEVAAREEVGARRERVELELVGGETWRGELLYTLPAGHSRVSDLLNSPGERFLMLLTPSETLFVHRAAIVRARFG